MFLSSSSFSLFFILHFYAIVAIVLSHTHEIFSAILFCVLSLKSKLAQFNKMSTQNQLRSNCLDSIQSYLPPHHMFFFFLSFLQCEFLNGLKRIMRVCTCLIRAYIFIHISGAPTNVWFSFLLNTFLSTFSNGNKAV